jgi:glycosyltransferase involved in cell wall biosynthesis
VTKDQSAPLSICHIIAGASTGGAETFCLDMVKALHERGIKQIMISRPHEQVVSALAERGIPHYPMGFQRWWKYPQQRKIRAIINAHAPDLVHCWMNRASSFVPSGLTPPVLGWFGGYYDLKNYQNCDFYMGVTRDIVRHIGEASGHPDRAYLGHTFGTLASDPPVSRADFGLPKDKPMVLLLSRMHWKKGVDLLLEAAARLPDMVFLMAGDGPDLEKYQRQAKALGVADRVCFAGWRHDRAALLNIADICVLPSRYEPFGTVIAEAWFAGVPLAATRADGAKQYVTHEKDGMLSDIDDLDVLVENLHRLATDKGLGKRLIKNGKKTYEDLFEREAVTSRLITSYEDMITRHGKHGQAMA